MDLSIQQLRMLREVSRRGTISSAAQHLGYTASAISQRISSLEKSTGIAMLERSGRNVLLTDAGRELVRHADLVLEQLAHAQAAIERVQGEAAGLLRLGFIESVGAPLLAPIMERLRRNHPALELRTMGVDSRQPVELIQADEIDISFLVGGEGVAPEAPNGFTRTPLCRDWFRVVVPHAWFQRHKPPQTIELARLAGEDFIAPPPSDNCGRAATLACREAGLDPYVAHRVASYATTIRLVGAGAGVALVPDLGLQPVPSDVVVLDLADPQYRTIELVYRRSSADRPAVQTFISVVRDVAGDLNLDLIDPNQMP